MISDERLRAILDTKDHEAAKAAAIQHNNPSECWKIIDGVLVIYDETDMPGWLAAPLSVADENGQTPLFRVTHPDRVIT